MCALLLACLFGSAGLSFAEAPSTQQSAAAEVPAGEEGGEHLSIRAPVVFTLASVPVTNSMITGWLAACILVLTAAPYAAYRID